MNQAGITTVKMALNKGVHKLLINSQLKIDMKSQITK
jgi:hypothetical protein